MTKLVLFLIVVLGLIAISAATVEIQFVQDYLVENTPIQLLIKTDKENIDGLNFKPTLSGEETADTSEVWTVATRSTPPEAMNLFGPAITSQSASPCYNGATLQPIGSLTATTTGSFQFDLNPNAKTLWANNFNAENDFGGKWEIVCPIVVTKPTKTQSTNVAFTTLTPSAGNIQLTAPSKGWVQPIITVGKSSKSDKGKYFGFPLLTFEVEVTTNVVGIIQAKGSDGLNSASDLIGTELSTIDNDFFCQVDGKNFARVSYRSEIPYIYVASVPTGPMKCKFQFINVLSKDGKPEITFTLMDKLASASVKIEDFDGNSNDYALGHLSKSISTNFTGSITVFSGAKLTSSKTIVITFSSNFNVNSLKLTEDYAAYSLCSVPVDIKADGQVVSLTNADFSDEDEDNQNYIDCSFEFIGTSDAPITYESMKSHYFTIDIDGKAVSDYYGTTGTHISFWLRSLYELEKEDVDEKVNGDVTTYTHKYDLTYSTALTSIPIQKPRFFVYFPSPSSVPTTVEKFSEFLTCESKLGDASYAPFSLKFDSKAFYWHADLTEINNSVDFEMKFRCSYNMPKLSKYGLNLAPALQLKAQVLDFNSKGLILITSDATSTATAPKQPTTEPTGRIIPTKAPYYRISHTQLIPTTDNYDFKSFQTQAATMSKAVSDLVQSHGKDDFTIYASIGSAFTVSTPHSSGYSSNYWNWNSAPFQQQWFSTVTGLKPQNVLASGVGLVSNEYKQFHSSTAQSVLVTASAIPLKVIDSAKPFNYLPQVADELYRDSLSLEWKSQYVPAVPATGSIYDYTTFEKCGLIDGWSVQVSGDTDITKWSDLVDLKPQGSSLLCAPDATCTINNDCSQAAPELGQFLCEGSKCVLKTLQPQQFIFLYSSSAVSPFLTVFVAIIMVIGIVF
jgi:hypothetical protein